MHNRLYHYTDRISLEKIRRDMRIKAQKMRVFFDLLPNDDRSMEIGPIVWLTINPLLDGTVLSKMILAGHNPESICRVSLPYISDTGLADFVEKHGHDYDKFIPLVQTGKMAGSDYTTWRIVEGDVVLDDSAEFALDLEWAKDHA